MLLCIIQTLDIPSNILNQLLRVQSLFPNLFYSLKQLLNSRFAPLDFCLSNMTTIGLLPYQAADFGVQVSGFELELINDGVDFYKGLFVGEDDVDVLRRVKVGGVERVSAANIPLNKSME